METKLYKYIVEIYDSPEDLDGDVNWGTTREIWAENADDAASIASMYYGYDKRVVVEVRGRIA